MAADPPGLGSFTTVYVCYQGIQEPLTMTQVVPYLEGLARGGYRMLLVTFDTELAGPDRRRIREELVARGIEWRSLRYHRWPSAPATAWDVLRGVVAIRALVRSRNVALIHARSHVAGLMALIIKRLEGTPLLFDLRGLMAEEYATAGHWRPGGLLYRATKRAERAILRAADGVVVLTERLRRRLRSEGLLPESTPTEVVPCCIDTSVEPDDVPAGKRSTHPQPFLTYVGKLRGRYWTEAMVQFFLAARARVPELRWEVWTQDDASQFRELLARSGVPEGSVVIGRRDPAELRRELVGAMAGLAFYRPGPDAVATSPTKIGDYLSAGVPVIANAGIGDVDEFLGGEDEKAIGAVVRPEVPESYDQAVDRTLALARDPDVGRRCREAASEHLDLERVGRRRYLALYRALVGSPDPEGKGRYRDPQAVALLHD